MEETNPRPSVTTDGELARLEIAYQVASDLCDEGICLIESNGDIVFSNRALLSWLQPQRGRVVRQSIWDWLPAAEVSSFRNQMASITHGDSAEAAFVSRFIAADGSQSPVELRIRRVPSEPAAMWAITARRRLVDDAIAALTGSAVRNDPLTGLPDRDALLDRLKSMLDRVATADQRFALLFIDVDEFKQVNDRFGHLIGDQVLREVAQRLAECVRSGDLLARFGGDEFVVLVDGIGSGGDGIRAVVKRIRAAFKPSFALPSGDVQMAVSVGVAEPSEACSSAEDLLRAADQAMYAAKRAEV